MLWLCWRIFSVKLRCHRLLNGFFGTGSSPPFEKGLHLIRRKIARTVPTTIPHSLTASMAYCEQEGVKRQVGVGLSGEIYLRYSFTGARNASLRSFTGEKFIMRTLLCRPRHSRRAEVMFPVLHPLRGERAYSSLLGSSTGLPSPRAWSRQCIFRGEQ